MNLRPTPAFRSTVLCTCVALLLAACGGGGGGESPTTATPAPVVAPASASPTALAPAPANQLAAPAAAGESPAPVAGLVSSTHGVGSEELAAFNLLNVERNRCGFGLLAQSAQLDTAARGHADYQIINGLLTHEQDGVRYPRGFTGRQPAERVAAAGYSGAGAVTDEIVGFFGTSVKTGLGPDAIRGLLSAPYHLRGLVASFRDVGISVRSSSDLGVASSSVYLQLNAAYKASQGPQSIGANEVNTYPCEGTTGVNRQLSNETPNPIPGRDLAVDPLGAVVYIGLREGNTLTISSAAMVEVATGRAVSLRAPVTARTDPYAPCREGCFKSHEAYVAADAPVKANTAYQVVLQGRNNNTPFSRSFVFTTGTGG